jgi:CBS domain-containing protein
MTSHRPVRVKEAMRAAFVSVEEGATPRRVLAGMDRAGIDELPVVGADGAFLSMVERRAVERHLYDRGEEDVAAATIAEDAIGRASPDESIDAAVNRMRASELNVLPVVSARGRLEGVLVLDDLRRVPDLVEKVDYDRHEHEVAAEAGVSRVMAGCSLAAAAMGVVLLALWIQGPVWGLPRWVAWVDALAGALAFIGAAAATSRGLISIPMWAAAGVGLCFTASVAHSWKDGAWTTLVQLVLGVAFLLMAFVLGATLPRRRHHRMADRTVTTAT